MLSCICGGVGDLGAFHTDECWNLQKLKDRASGGPGTFTSLEEADKWCDAQRILQAVRGGMVSRSVANDFMFAVMAQHHPEFLEIVKSLGRYPLT